MREFWTFPIAIVLTVFYSCNRLRKWWKKRKKGKGGDKMANGYGEMLIIIIAIAVICFASGGGGIYAWLYSKYDKWRNLKNED